MTFPDGKTPWRVALAAWRTGQRSTLRIRSSRSSRPTPSSTARTLPPFCDTSTAQKGFVPCTRWEEGGGGGTFTGVWSKARRL